jgi:beta-lactamase class A
MTVGGMLAVVLSPSKIRYDAGRSLTKTKRIKAALTGCFSLTLAVLLFVGIQFGAVVFSSRNIVYAEEQSFVYSSSNVQTGVKAEQQANDPAIDAAEVQRVVDAWSKKYQQKASVTILDTKTGKLLASTQETKQYFTASIYKLYVAYTSLQDIDTGKHDGNESFLNGSTRLECITKMIQFSDSPCAEKMMNEMGKTVLQNRLSLLGLTTTSMPRFMTTTADAALMTRKVALGEGLSPKSALLLQTAMSKQQYRTGLPAGFSNMQVADKVGFSEKDWHDTANVTPKNGNVFTVSVFTEKMSSKNIAELARLLQPLFEKA